MTTVAESATVNHATFTIERTFPVAPSRVFAAFADPAKKRRWFAAGAGHAVTEPHQMDFQVGGREHSERRIQGGPIDGARLENDTVYMDIIPDARIVLAYTMSVNGKRISSSLATFELQPTAEGTRLVFTDQGAYFENSDGQEIRKQGWTTILNSLAAEIESDR
jgi:uncharacterized protein YndB with AHSA1/START domain